MPEASKKRFKVTRGNSFVWVSPKRNGWRFRWHPEPGKPLEEVFRRTKADAQEAAYECLGKIPEPIQFSLISQTRRAFLEAVHREASETDQQAILDFIASRKKSGNVVDAVARFLAFKKASAKGEETPHLSTMRRDLEAFAEAFADKMVIDIPISPLTEWWNERTGTAGDHRRKAIRGFLVGFFRWAQGDGIAGNDPKTVAQRLPSVHPDDGRLEIYTLAELTFLLSIVEERWFPLIILGAFEGIRPEEIAPKKKNRKPRLRWEHIRWEFNTIEIPKEVAKGVGKKKRRRIVPLHPVTRAWLEAYGAKQDWTGPICDENPTEVYRGKDRITTIWGKALAEKFPSRFTEWPQDALRHSYASYRNAVVRNLHQVAEEMGNSEAMLHSHYHNPQTTEKGKAWFDFTPQKMKNLPDFLAVTSVPKSPQKSKVEAS